MVFFFGAEKKACVGVFPRAENRRLVCVFLEQKICSGSFICSRIIFSQFFRQSERLICAVAEK